MSIIFWKIISKAVLGKHLFGYLNGQPFGLFEFLFPDFIVFDIPKAKESKKTSKMKK
jgi:hypothetical protein